MSIANKQDFVQDKDFLQQYSKLPEVLVYFIYNKEILNYFNLKKTKKKSKVTIRFFDRGDYFSLHGKYFNTQRKKFSTQLMLINKR